MGTLYVVATPIGNLEDITLRALRVLARVSLIAAEDTRTTRKLLARHQISARLLSYHEHNRRRRIPQLLDVLEQGDVALVSEAGTPGVSDPGLELVQAATQKGFPVVAVPGPSAMTATLAVAGLPASRFAFVGFLPARGKERRAALEGLARQDCTLVLYEAPHRLIRALQDLQRTLGDRKVAVARELTKAHEEVFRGTISEALDHFTEPRGEFTLVVEGAPAPAAPAPDEAAVRHLLASLRDRGLSPSRAVTQAVRDLGVSRREAYRAWVALAREGGEASVDRAGGLG